jgi:hypothetical protein
MQTSLLHATGDTFYGETQSGNTGPQEYIRTNKKAIKADKFRF